MGENLPLYLNLLNYSTPGSVLMPCYQCITMKIESVRADNIQ